MVSCVELFFLFDDLYIWLIFSSLIGTAMFFLWKTSNHLVAD